MGNGNEAADFVTKRSSEHGITYALEKLEIL